MRKLFIILSALMLVIVGCNFNYDNPNVGDDNGSNDSEVIVSSPTEGSEVSSPLNVEGEAPGTWFFEARAQVRLLDASGDVLATAPATTDDDWQTEDLVSFEAELEFDAPTSEESGTLVFASANPSGLPENEMTFEVPVVLGAE